MRQWAVSLRLRSLLTGSLCYALANFAALCLSGPRFVAVGGIAPPSVFPHRLPVLHCATLSLAHPNCDRLCSISRRWVVSLHLRSLLTASLCLAPLIHAERFWTIPNPAKLRSALFRASGWYCSTFGLSSLAPFAELYLAKPNLAKRH